MKPVLTVTEMRRVDADTTVPVDTLMMNAGYAVALEAASMGIGYGSRVQVLCGKGNNGGDGYVAAAHLARRGAKVTVQAYGDPAEGSPASRAAAFAAINGVGIVALGEPRPADLVIDALFGTGFSGELPDVTVPWIVSGFPMLAVDIPSGLDGDTGEPRGVSFRADRTVAFHAAKPGHLLGRGPEYCGEVVVHDIGLFGGDPLMSIMESTDVIVPVRDRSVHKWQAGAVATVGGVPGLTGAAMLTARTALRAGAGVSTILTTAATNATYGALAPEIPTMQASETELWRDHASEVLSLLGRFDTLVVGPGLEPAPTTFVERLLESFEGAIVVDAGAIGGIRRLDTLLERSAPTVLTPHAGEFRRLTGMDASPIEAQRLAEATGSVVLLKGNPTFVAGESLVAVTTGGPELASIGTGDVLAGIIAALLAQGVPADSAAASGAYIHGLAGASLAAERIVTALDLIERVPAVMATL